MRFSLSEENSDSVNDVKFSPEKAGFLLANCCNEGSIRIYQLEHTISMGCGMLMVFYFFSFHFISFHFISFCKIVLQSKNFGIGPLRCVSWFPGSTSSGSIIAAGSKNGMLAFLRFSPFSLKDAQEFRSIQAHDAEVTSIHWAPKTGFGFLFLYFYFFIEYQKSHKLFF